MDGRSGLLSRSREARMDAAREKKLKAKARMAVEVLNTGNLDLLDEIARPDFVDRTPDPGQGPGLEGLKVAFKRFRIAFPDLRVTVDAVHCDGDYVTLRETMEGTNKGELYGNRPTGKQMKLTVIDIIRFENGLA